MIAEDLEAAVAAARDAEREVGRLRGELLDLRTQLARAEQDIALGRGYWLRRNRQLAKPLMPRRTSAVGSPVVSILTAVYDTPPTLLEACLRSVARLDEPRFEHILVDDGSTAASVIPMLERAARHDGRRRIVRLASNEGIVAASARALALARAPFIALLDHDDELAPNALSVMLAAFDRPGAGEVVMAYSDHVMVRADGRECDPSYKPDFSPERLRCHNYITHLVMARRSAVERVGGFRAGFDGAQDHDLVLRLSEDGRVEHVTEALYRWRMSPASVASSTSNKQWAFDAGVRAVQEHCVRGGVDAMVERSVHDGVYRVRRRIASEPLVSIVIPTRGAIGRVWGVERTHVLEAVASLDDRSTYRNVEFVIVTDSDTEPETIAALRRELGDRGSIVEYRGPFNFSRSINLGVGAASGDLLLFLNDDTELIEPDSVREMVGLALDADVGMVGAKLLYADGTIQHAGHVYPGLATHALLGFDGEHPGPSRMAVVARECSGVTAAAAMIRATLFGEVGGFDEAFPSNFNDVDLSLRVRRAGYRIVWTPHASWYHFESASRAPATTDDERDLVLARWSHELQHDPYFNPNLAPQRSDWLERPGRSGAPPYYVDGAGRRRFVEPTAPAVWCQAPGTWCLAPNVGVRQYAAVPCRRRVNSSRAASCCGT